MKRSAFIALVGILTSAVVDAGDLIVLKSDKPLCNNAPALTDAATIKANRVDQDVEVEVVAEMNCAYKAGTPQLAVWRNAASVNLPTVPLTPGVAAACLCQHKLTFEIQNIYKGAKVIYYVQDGNALAHANVP